MFVDTFIQFLQHRRRNAMLIALLQLATAVYADQTISYQASLAPTSGLIGWGCGDALPIRAGGTWQATYTDLLPEGAKVTNVKIEMLMSQSNGNSATPTVGVALDGQTIGSTVS